VLKIDQEPEVWQAKVPIIPIASARPVPRPSYDRPEDSWEIGRCEEASTPGQAGDFPTPEIVALALASPGGFVNLPTTAVREHSAQLSDLVLQACYLIRGQGLDAFFYPVQFLGDMGIF